MPDGGTIILTAFSVDIKGFPAFSVYSVAKAAVRSFCAHLDNGDFVRQHQKTGGFWLPQRDETFVQVRLYGKRALTIDYQDYTVNPTFGKYQSAQSLGNL
jgi:hypothetical protein